MPDPRYDQDDASARRWRRIRWILLVAVILVIGWSVKGAFTWHDRWSNHAGGQWWRQGEQQYQGDASDQDVRQLTGFDSVTLRGNTTLVLTVGSKASVSLEGDEEAVKAVRARVKDDTLVIAQHRAGWFGRSRSRVTAHVTVPSLETLDIAGSNSVTISGMEKGESQIIISGAGRLTAEGRMDALHLIINGTGHVDLEDLAVDDVVVVLNGAGGVTVDVRKNLVATVNGAGHIRYTGEPEHVTSSVHGVGSVKRS